MQEVLLRKLIEENHFTPGTEVHATYKGFDLCGSPVHMFEQIFTVSRIFETRKTKRILMDVISTVDGRTIRISCEHINRIDGMAPERFGESFMIDESGGTIKPTGARRGRRPKGWTEDDGLAD